MTNGTWSRLRTALLGILLLGTAGVFAELILLEHTESRTQYIPLVVMGAGAVAAVLALFRPSRAVTTFLRVTMAAFIAAGIAGLYYHYRGNVEFELEMDPALTGLALVWESLRGATPALAPGAMIQLGLVGLAATYNLRENTA